MSKQIKERYFCYDPEVGFESFETEDACQKYANDCIQEHLDDRWDENVEHIVTGIITKQATMCDVKPRPPQSEIDENGCDADGNDWSDCDIEYRCNYEMRGEIDECTNRMDV